MNSLINFKNILNENIDLSKYLSEDHKVRVAGVSTFLRPLMEMLTDGGEKGHSTPWNASEGKFSFRPQELTVWTGFKGHGKSLVISQVMEKFLEDGKKIFIISPEFPPHRVLHRMIIQSIGKDHVTPTNAWAWLEAVEQQIWLYDQQSSLNPLDVIALCRYAVEEHGVDHILIDSLMKCGVDGDGNGYITKQKNFVDALQQVAHRNPVHIHLVAHARKQTDDHKVAGLHDIKGASDIADLAENCIVVWRNKQKELGGGHVDEPDCIVKIEAQRNGNGEIFSMPLWFRKSTFTFHDHE